MDIAEQYSTLGYCIIRNAFKLDKIEKLRQAIPPFNERKRRVTLFDDSVTVEAINAAVKPVFKDIQVNVNELVELFLLITQAPNTVKLGWHKDKQRGNGVHSFQLPLLAGDNIHQLVPSTHIREINEAEVSARNAGGNAMPNAVRIDLAVGDILLRSPFILHRGYSLKGINRLTFVGTYSDTDN